MKPLLMVLSFLRLDVESGAVTARQWTPEEVVEVGSLAKPFVALAYAQGHGFVYPEVECKRCWSPRGHGKVGMEQAIAQSCNTYFETLRAALRPGELEGVAQRFGLEGADRVRPERLLRAYVELQRRGAEPGVAPILAGMRLAAKSGTAKGLGRDALAKTGTAACGHKQKAPGDGFAVVLYPAVNPRVAVLVRLHSRPGAHAAREARTLLQ